MDVTRFEPANPITRVTVRSSNVVSIGHDTASGVLEVEYTTGVYRYAGVPARVFEIVMRSPSVGAALAQDVRGRYDYATVEAETPVQPAADDPGPPLPAPKPRQRHRSGPKPGPVEATRTDVDLRRPQTRLADGAVQAGAGVCGVCGRPATPDLDDARAKAGILRCPVGHVEISSGVDARLLESRR